MVAVITGASKGIGLALAKELIKKGYKVYSFSRTAPDDAEVFHIHCDIASKQSVEDAFKAFFEKEQRIDLLVNNAGIGISGAAEFTKEEDLKNIFDINFNGAVYCCQQVISAMRAQRFGKIVFISSAAAIFTVPFQSFYSATKTAVAIFGEGLSMELKPFNIKVGTLLLCDTKTAFTASRRKDVQGSELYGGRIERSVAVMEKDEQNGMDAAKVAKKIAQYLKKKNLKNIKPLGLQFGIPVWLFVFLNKVLPRKWILSVIYRIYGK